MSDNPCKTYKILDTEFTTEKNVLKIQNAFLPLGIYFDKLNKMYTSEVETDVLDVYKRNMDLMNNKNRLDKESLKNLEAEKTPDKKVIDRVTKAIKQNEIDIESLNKDYRNDKKAQAQQTELNEATGYAMAHLLTSFDMVKIFLDKYLIGDTSKIDYEKPEAMEFVKEVVTDFFLSQMQNKVKLTN